jgi:glycerol kinase
LSTKTFKPGEYGYHPKIKVTVHPNEVMLDFITWEGTRGKRIIHSLSQNNVHYAVRSDVEEDTTPFYASTICDWIMETREFKNKVQTGFTFNY